MNGLGTDEAPRAAAQFVAQRHDAAFERGGRLPGLAAGSRRLIASGHLRQRLRANPPDPVLLKMGQAHAKAPGHGAWREAAPHRRPHRPPFGQREFFLGRRLPEGVTSFDECRCGKLGGFA